MIKQMTAEQKDILIKNLRQKNQLSFVPFMLSATFSVSHMSSHFESRSFFQKKAPETNFSPFNYSFA